MILIVGGMGQGKLDYVLHKTGLDRSQVAETLEEGKNRPVLYGLHLEVARLVLAGEDPVPAVEELLTCNPDVIVICDEVGCGVVPIDPGERAWREAVGRICCDLASRAQRVERIFCGLPMVLKGEEKWN